MAGVLIMQELNKRSGPSVSTQEAKDSHLPKVVNSIRGNSDVYVVGWWHFAGGVGLTWNFIGEIN